MLFYKFTFLWINFSWTSIKYHHDLAENTGINGHFFHYKMSAALCSADLTV